jgi:hypothetical protein
MVCRSGKFITRVVTSAFSIELQLTRLSDNLVLRRHLKCNGRSFDKNNIHLRSAEEKDEEKGADRVSPTDVRRGGAHQSLLLGTAR